jgi:hypothetical protein
MEAALVAASSSLAGVALGMFGNWLNWRRQERVRQQLEVQTREREQAVERRRVAGLIADEFIKALRFLRSLDERYFEELVEEVFLPKHWYENYEPTLLRLIGGVDEESTRRALTDVVTLLSDRHSHSRELSGYHYVESQLLLGVEIANAHGRNEPLEASARAALDALRARRAEEHHN